MNASLGQLGRESWDVVVIGAGPAGSATASLLAQSGFRTLILEKEQFPRFQIGESLLPVCLPMLARVGVAPHPDTHLYKRGAEFVCEEINRRHVFDFSRALGGTPLHAWQVDRAGFDAQVRDAAIANGATAFHGAKVRSVEFLPDSVTLEAQSETDSSATFRARYVIDASGQNRLLARHFRSAEPYPGFGHSAAFVHFEGLSEETMQEIGPGHEIRVMIVPEGWGWVIPLPRRRLSVGLVTRQSDVVGDLQAYLKNSDLIQRWTTGTTFSEPKVVRNFSFRNLRPYGPRYACVGDAACFLDPVFSSGVSLALVGAGRTTDQLIPALSENREAAPSLMAPVSEAMNQAYEAFSAIIHRFYHTQFVRNVIFGDTRDENVERGIISVLAGDVWRDDNKFQQALVTSRRSGPNFPSSLVPPNGKAESSC
jgi:flavin-dependent dehydrogenase